ISFNGCSRLSSFPDISTKISELHLEETGIEEVPWWTEKFSNLTHLRMRDCSRLKCVFLHISKLKHLYANFLNCEALTRVDLSGYPSGMEMMEVDNIPEEASSSLPDSCVPKVYLDFMDCFNLDPETVLHQQSVIFNSIRFPGKEEVPSYFTHREECAETVVTRQRETASDCRLREGPLKKPLLYPASDPGHAKSLHCLPSWRDVFG
ncbi:unnamed protein product, partial [Arabidopsis halleri]